MKSSLLASLILSTLIATNANAGILDSLKIGNSISKDSKHKDVYSGVKFQYFDQEDRIQIINDLLRSIELEYAPLKIKEKRIGLDIKKIREEAILSEKNVENILLTSEARSNTELRAKIASLQAKSNMDFIDRMHLLIAKFQDTHFGINTRIPRPLIHTGLRLRKVQGMVVVAAMDKKFMSMVQKLSGSNLGSIQPGDVVLSIDGVPVADKINELKKYIAGSSEEYREAQAIRSLTLRDVLYPTKNYMTIEFARAGVFKLPVFANVSAEATPRIDAMEYFKSVGIPTDTSTIGMSYDAAKKQWDDSALNFEGYTPWSLHTNLKGLNVYLDDNGAPGMRTGYYMKNGKTYGVLQLLTFYTQNLKVGNNSLTFLDAIRGFVAELKENGMPLILDLRLNGGGNGSFPDAVLSILAKKDAVYGSGTAGFRITPYTRQLNEPYLFQQVIAEDISGGLSNDDFIKMFQDTIDSRKDLTPFYSASAVVPDDKIGGFDNKIVALITTDCISACDKMASALQTSGRAILIGTQSNGTGAGYSSSGEYNAEWTDSLKVFSTQIPNHLFGKASDPSVRIFGEDSALELDLENRPTIADVKYVPMAKDFSKNNTGWLEKAIEVIEGMK